MAASILSEDVILLQWLYNCHQWSNRLWIYGEIWIIILEVFIPKYRPSVECPSLRYALLAFASAMNDNGIREATNAVYAGHVLRKKISEHTLSEGDLFASVFLALASVPNPENGVKHHLKGFLAILESLSQGRSRSSLPISWSLARDILLWAVSDQKWMSDEDYLQFVYDCRQLLGPSTWERRNAYVKKTYCAILRSLTFHRRILKCAVRLLRDVGSYFPEFVKSTLADSIDDLGQMGELSKKARSLKQVGSWVRYRLAQGIFRVLQLLYEAGGIIKGFRSEPVLQEIRSMREVVINSTGKILYRDIGPFPDRAILAETIALWALAWPREALPDLFLDKGEHPHRTLVC